MILSNIGENLALLNNGSNGDSVPAAVPEQEPHLHYDRRSSLKLAAGSRQKRSKPGHFRRNCSGVGLTGVVIAVVTGRRAGLAQPTRTGDAHLRRGYDSVSPGSSACWGGGCRSRSRRQ
jgi:hypothetical protein